LPFWRQVEDPLQRRQLAVDLAVRVSALLPFVGLTKTITSF
jgi:hypothetical protein